MLVLVSGWVDTPGVQEAYGEKKSNLEPLRTPREGADTLIWLLAIQSEKLESGAN